MITKKVLAVFLSFVILFASIGVITASADENQEDYAKVLYDFEYVTGEENKGADNYVSTYNLPTYSATYLNSTGNAGYDSRKELAQALYEQDIPLYMWPNAAVGDTTNTSATVTIVSADDGEPVLFGKQSLRIDFDFSNFNKLINANFYLRTTAPMYRFEGSPTAIGVWVYAPEGTTPFHLYLQCAGKVDVIAGTSVNSYQCLTTPEAMGTDSNGISWTGWRYLEFDLTGTKGNIGVSNVGDAYEPYGQQTDNGIFWISYQPSNMGTDVTSDTIYLDNITLIYGSYDASRLGWQYIDSDIYYYKPDDCTLATGKQVIDGAEYAFDADGKLMLTDENFELNGLYYYFNKVGNIETTHIRTHPYSKQILEAVEPGCVDSGLTEGEKCATCGLVIKEQEYLGLQGHTIEIIPGSSATCTSSGLTDGAKCTVCGDIIASQQVIDAKGHSYIANVTSPTCTEMGYTTYVCYSCGDSYVDDYVDAKGHTEIVLNAVAPGCKTEGLTAGRQCISCGVVTESQIVIPATNHEGSIMIIPGREVTCTSDGITDGKFCTICGEILAVQSVISATGHQEEVLPGVDASCTEYGVTEGLKCSCCNMMFVHQMIIPVAGHSYDTVVTEPTETEDGYTTYTCVHCGDSYVSDYTEFVPDESTTIVNNPFANIIESLNAFFARISEFFARLFNF